MKVVNVVQAEKGDKWWWSLISNGVPIRRFEYYDEEKL